MLRYVDACLTISDVDVRYPLVNIGKFAFPLLIGMDVLRFHNAIFESSAFDVVRLKVDRCFVCVKKRVPITPRRDAAAVPSDLCDTTLSSHAPNRVPVGQQLKVLDDSTSFV